MLAALALARNQAEADLHEAFAYWLYEVQRDTATNHASSVAFRAYETARDRYDALSVRVQQELAA
jgi:hypothetical protein